MKWHEILIGTPILSIGVYPGIKVLEFRKILYYHFLSRNLAIHFNYNYVLFCMIPNNVNIRHGRF
ncbi:hypothetical protein GS03_02372 [Flavobacterium sangjuense]|uniref:Uncharacterized protein n=1 Tax=Flavobacterium sangjuense TaxID=2518177 RepID=A0A4P7PWN6_9FLAO|nr:hypothetical protein GS03_02372 [Flavobacterium sangjuense]